MEKISYEKKRIIMLLMAAFKDVMHEHKSQHCIRQQSPDALPILVMKI